MVAIGLVGVVGAVAGCYRPPAALGPAERATWARELAVGVERGGSCPSAPLSLADAEALALSEHPALRVADAERRAAQAAVDEPRAREPELRVGTVRLDEVLDGGARFGVGLRAMIAPPGTLDAEAHAAREEARVVDAVAADQARLQLAEVRLAHAEALAAGARGAVAVRRLVLAEQALARRAEGARGGAVTRIDADRAELEAAAARDEVAAARAAVATAEDALAAAVGVHAGCGVEAVGVLGAVAEGPGGEAGARLEELEALVGRALGRRPVVIAAEARVARGAARRFVAERRRWPWFDFAQIEYEAGEGATPTRWGLSVAVTLPVFRLGGGEVAAREAEAWLARAEAERDVAAVVDEVAAARRGVEVARARLEAAREALVSYPAARLEALAAAVVRGKVDPDEVTALARARLRLVEREIDAALAARRAWIALERAVGEPTSR